MVEHHAKYIFETCEYCTEWRRPPEGHGNADYIKHVIKNHLWTAAIGEGDRVKLIDPPPDWFGVLGTVSLIKDYEAYVNFDNGEPRRLLLRRLVRADAID